LGRPIAADGQLVSSLHDSKVPNTICKERVVKHTVVNFILGSLMPDTSSHTVQIIELAAGAN
jgi:hypothetical protein